MLITIPFRKQTPYELQAFQINNSLSNLLEKFQDLHKTTIRSYEVLTDEKQFTVQGDTPAGIIYKKDGLLYAMGVCDRVGEYTTDDEFTRTLQREAEFTLWGPYQRIGWTCGEIRRLLVWRKRTMDKPCRIYMQLVETFEKSRWMLFCFWPGKIDDLIEMELQFMDKVMEQDDLICGNMRTRVPKLYGLQTVKELKEMVREQYQKTTFTLNETEKQFIRNRARFGKQIEQIYKY